MASSVLHGRLPLALAVLALMAGCSTAATPSPTADSRATPQVRASTSASPGTATDGPTLSPGPTPESTEAAASRLRWTRAGALDVGDGELLGLVRLRDGYVAWGHAYPDGADPDEDSWVLATWTSSDLRSWTRVLHRFPVEWCPGWAPGSETEEVAAAADETTLVIVFDHPAPDPAASNGCIQTEGLSLATHDGLTWIRSGALPPGPQVRPWRIPGGWEIHQYGVSVWQTADLLTWREVGGDLPNGRGVLAVSDDGTRLMAAETSAGRSAIFASSDGTTWTKVRTLRNAIALRAFAPVPGDPRWVVLVGSEVGTRPRLLFSTDLQAWSRSEFPRAGIGPMVRTPGGWLAVGYSPDPPAPCERNEDGDLICPLAVPPSYRKAALYTSDDGRTWVRHPGSLLPDGSIPAFMADGEGVLAIPLNPWGDGQGGRIRIWRLERAP